MMPTDLAAEWLKLAEQQDQLGAEAQATTLRFCAQALEASLEGEDNTLLSLQEAAAESGYSADHLGRLVREGKIPNAGRPNAPRIAAGDLPRKSGTASLARASNGRQTDTSEIVRLAIEGVK